MPTLSAKNAADSIPGVVLKKIKEELEGKDEAEHRPEILDGFGQLKHGEYGRVTNMPSVSACVRRPPDSLFDPDRTESLSSWAVARRPPFLGERHHARPSRGGDVAGSARRRACAV